MLSLLTILQLDGKEQSAGHKLHPSPSSTWHTPLPHIFSSNDDGEDVGFDDGMDEGCGDEEGSDEGVWLDVGCGDEEGSDEGAKLDVGIDDMEGAKDIVNP